jgi:phosphatidylinositol glycan class B
MPRMVGVVVAAVTDWATYRLSSKLMGPGSAAGAVSSSVRSLRKKLTTQFFLSTTNIFNAHALTRSLSNSPETMLTTLALVYFPLLPPNASRAIAPSALSPVDLVSMKERQQSRKADAPTPVDNVQELDYVVMDRAGPDFDKPETYVLWSCR